ncbi:retrovirus-related Pol polyprotein from transposon opus [Trichonephila clavipes]|nr:retrovirus-related Pol polyprotein from transposon opus [Trichonephila clavipes]
MFGDNFCQRVAVHTLSNDTVSRRIDDISEDVEQQLFGKLRRNLFSIQATAADSNKEMLISLRMFDFGMINAVETNERFQEQSSAILTAKVAIPVYSPAKEDEKIDELQFVHIKCGNEILKAVIDTGAQISVVRADVVEGQSVDSGGTIQIMSAFGEREVTELKIFNLKIDDSRHGVVPIMCAVSKRLVNDMLVCSSACEALLENVQFIHNPRKLLRIFKRAVEGEPIQTRSTDHHAVAQSVVVEKEKEEISVDVIKDKDEISFQLHRPGMTDELLRGGVGVERSINTCKGMGSSLPLGMWNVKWQHSVFGYDGVKSCPNVANCTQ